MPPFCSTMCSHALRRVRGVDHDHQLVVEPVDRAVVHEGALGREDRRSTARRPARARDDVVAGDPVDEGVPVGAGDLELAHVGDVEDARRRSAPRGARRGCRWGTAPASPSRRTAPSWRRARLCAVVAAAVRWSVGRRGHAASSHQRRHQRLLHVQPVLGLVPDPRLRALDHRPPTPPRRGGRGGSGGRWRRGSARRISAPSTM